MVHKWMIAAFCCVVGCADNPDQPDALDPLRPDTDTDLSPRPVTSYWSIEATLPIYQGAIDTEQASIILEVVLPDADPCTSSHTITSVSAGNPPESIAPLAWWALGLGPSPTPCSPTWIGHSQDPQQIVVELGIGLYDAQLDPAAQAGGYSTDNAYGLYTLDVNDPAEVYVFGMASNTTSSRPPVSAGSLPDGTYSLVSLYQLPGY